MKARMFFAAFAAAVAMAANAEDLHWSLDSAHEPTFGAYGSEADWWDWSGAEVKRVGDALEIRNVDNNASITPDEIARELLGLPADAPITKKEAAEAKQKLYEGKRAKGRVNHGLFSQKIPVESGNVEISFKARFDDIGGFIEIASSCAYGPYINTKDGAIVVDAGGERGTVLDNVVPGRWYDFFIIIDAANKAAAVNVRDMKTREGRGLSCLKLFCHKPVEWYQVNFFPASAYGKKMSIKDFKVSAYQGETTKTAPLAKTGTKPTATAPYVHDKTHPLPRRMSSICCRAKEPCATLWWSWDQTATTTCVARRAFPRQTPRARRFRVRKRHTRMRVFGRTIPASASGKVPT